MSSIQSIRGFLGLHRLAVVGVSRNPRDFTRTMFRELRARGYDVVPVNPGVPEVDGLPCLPNVYEAEPPVEGALLMTNPAVTEEVVRECAAAGIHHIWMYSSGHGGAVSPEAVAYCRMNGIDLVKGECPFMFLSETSWPHRLHGFCRKLVGRYPN